MKKYNKYKDSGIEWIGEIPEHWDKVRLKNIGFLYSGLSGKSGSDFNNEENPNNKHFINFTNICNNLYVENDNFGLVNIEEGENQNLVQVGDLFFLMSSENQEDVGKSAVIVNDFGELYLNSFCKGFRTTKANIVSEYINYLLNSNAVKQLISIEGRGFTRINLRMEGVTSLPIILPPKEEQHLIATYLDRKTAQIDDLISKKEKLIELLKEERAAMINQAVTKGLDNNVPMKDSGIEWLGEIPEGWEVKPLKHICNIQGRVGYKGYTISDLVEKGEGPYTLGAKHINKMNQLDLSQPEFISWEKYYESPEIMVFQNDLLLTQRGTLGKVVLIEENIGEATINPSMVLLNKLKANGKFLYYFFCSEYFTKWIDLTNTATAVPMISQQQLGNFKLTIPPEREQISIIEYLYEKQQIFNELTLRISNQVALLKEYKTALISEVVTGKLKVIED